MLDSLEPPAGEWTDAELALWRGHCPWCDKPAAFSASEVFDGSLICRYCGLEFLGVEPDPSGRYPARAVIAIYVEGAEAKRAAIADDLPAVSERA